MKSKEEIEKFVKDWHWDEESKIHAFEMGKFLFSFINNLEEQKLSDKMRRKHINNLYIIGIFELSYGYNEEFHPKNLENGPHFLHEFKRKVSDAQYAVKSYESTWRKLDKYIKSAEYKRYLDEINEGLKK